MEQSETIILYTLEDARKIIIHKLLINIKKIIKKVILTALVIVFGIVVMCLIEGTIGIFTIVIGIAVIQEFTKNK